MSDPDAPARRNLGLIAAIVFAAVGAGAAGWTLIAHGAGEARREARLADAPSGNRPPSREAMARRNAARAPAGDGQRHTFPATASETDLRAMMANLADELGSRVRATPSVSAMGQRATALPEAARLAIEPFILNSRDSMAATLKTLGGAAAALDGENRAFARLSALLRGMALDTSAMTIRPAPPPGAPREREGDGPAERIAMRPATFFPDVMHYEDEKLPAVQVTIPARPAGADDAAGPVDLTLTLVWNEKAGVWQPAQFDLSSSDPAAMAAAMAAMRGGKD